MRNNEEREKFKNDIENVTLQIKEEHLEIAKKWIQTGDVKVYKKTFTEEKSFSIPIKHEELVIEKLDLTSNKQNELEIIRIPLSEEKVEFSKHTVNWEDVSVYKHKLEELKHIEETLRREEPKIKITGSPMVKDESNLIH